MVARRGAFRPGPRQVVRIALRAGQRRDGRRANFEEPYSGESLQGNYIGAIYYPDKTRVGWWKNGYPEYFAKVPNAAFWLGVDVRIDGEELDLAAVGVLDFYRETDMRRGGAYAADERADAERCRGGGRGRALFSLARRELGVVRYSVTP